MPAASAPHADKLDVPLARRAESPQVRHTTGTLPCYPWAYRRLFSEKEYAMSSLFAPSTSLTIQRRPALTPRPALRRAFAINAPLTIAGLAMLLAVGIAVIDLVVDHQTLPGAPAWLKPAKFAFSLGLYCFTLLYLLTFVRGHRVVVTLASTAIALGVIIEMALIATQAVRGTTSHFNFSTTLDATIFNAMGSFIVIVWTMSLVIALLLLRQPIADAAWAWTLRLGLLLSLVGMAAAGPMLRPTPAQLAAARSGPMLHTGAHSVGVADGGPGLPILGWSTVGGDLRVPHFIGIHGLQLMLIVGLLLTLGARWLDARHRVALVWTAALGYLGLIVLLEWQALRGQSVVRPDSATIVSFPPLPFLSLGAAPAVLWAAPARGG